MGHGPGAAAIPGEKAHDFKGTIKKLLIYLGKYKLAIALVLFFAVLSAAFNIIGPKILGQATTEVFNGILAQIRGTGGINFGYIGMIVLIMVALYFFSSGFSFVQGWVMNNISMKVTYRFRKDISQKINRMPLKYFESTSQGEVLSRITNDVDTVSHSLQQSLTQIITSVTTIIGVLIMMFTISVPMTLTALCIVPLSLVFVMLIVKRSQHYFCLLYTSRCV